MQHPNALSDLPNIEPSRFAKPALDRLTGGPRADHAPRILMLFGSLRELAQAMDGAPANF